MSARASILELKRRYDRLITYGVVGGAIACLQMALTALIGRDGTVDPSVASLFASAFTIPIAFWMHKRTTYADVARARFQAARFTATAICSVVIAAGTIKLVQLNHGPFLFGVVLGSALVPIGNYAVNAFWVFRTKNFFSIEDSSS